MCVFLSSGVFRVCYCACVCLVVFIHSPWFCVCVIGAVSEFVVSCVCVGVCASLCSTCLSVFYCVIKCVRAFSSACSFSR